MNSLIAFTAIGLSLGLASWAAGNTQLASPALEGSTDHVQVGSETYAADQLVVKITPEVYPFSRLDELVRFSDTIVVGRVSGSTEKPNAGGLPHVEHSIDFDETLTGGDAESGVVILAGGRGNGYHVAVEGAPELAEGEQYLLFLRRAGDAYSLVGLSAGVYPLRDWDSAGGGTVSGPHAPGGMDAVEFIGAVVDILVQQESEGLRSR